MPTSEFDLSEWLNSCFDKKDARAPARAFVLGATLASLAAGISSLAVDPTDWQMVLGMLAGSTFLGGGCGAMFALPPETFCQLLSRSFKLFSFLPLKLLVGIGLWPFVLVAFSLYVAIIATLAALQVLHSLARSTIQRGGD